MGPGPGRALGPGPAAGPGPCSRPRAQGPVRARPHVRIYGSYCMYMYISRYYICIYVYFGILTFSVLPFTFSILGFWDSHFQRLAVYIFNFWLFWIVGVPDHGKSWEIVGNRVKLSPKPGESWEIVGRSWGIVEMVPNP